MGRFIKKDGRHRTLEGWPIVFTVMVLIAVFIGGFVEFLPLAIVKSNIPRIKAVTPFTALEVAGRDIYIREGCNNCHSQMVRPFRHELERYGEYGKPGETVYEHPFLWGSKRTGPDLAREGGKYPNLWHVRHMEDPRSTSPRSLMPPYPWLLERELDLEILPRRMRALSKVGVPYTGEQIANAITDAEIQAQEIAADVASQSGPEGIEDKEIVALVAFLQRLGTDIKTGGTAPVGATMTKDPTEETEPVEEAVETP